MDSFFEYDYICLDVPKEEIKPTPFVDIYQERHNFHKGIYPKDQFGTVYGTGFAAYNFREKETDYGY